MYYTSQVDEEYMLYLIVNCIAAVKTMLLLGYYTSLIIVMRFLYIRHALVRSELYSSYLSFRFISNIVEEFL